MKRGRSVIIPDSVRGLQIVGSTPRGIAKSPDSDAARQAAFDLCSDEIRREERERDRHVDLTHAALLT